MSFTTVTELNNILFKDWNTSSWKDIVIASVIICTLTVIFEGLKTIKSIIIVIRKSKQGTKVEGYERGSPDNDVMPSVSSQTNLLSTHIMSGNNDQTLKSRGILFFIESLLHTFNFLCGYILMLLVMTYSVWFLLSVVVGSGVGFFISHPFGQFMTYRYSQKKELNTDSCHGGETLHPMGPFHVNAGIIRS